MAIEPSDSTVWGAGSEVQIPGPPGPQGPVGPPPNLSKGSVSSGIDADFTIRGTSPNYVIDMVLPEGAPGSPGAPGTPGQFASVHVTTLPPGSPATASISGPSTAQVLELGIPQGNAGTNGDPGPVGPAGPISQINNVGTGVPVFEGMSGDEGEEANFRGIINARTIKASIVADEGISLRYTPSFGIVQRSQDAAVTSPAVISWQTVSGTDTSIFNAGTPDHITVPSGITQIEILAQIEVSRNNPDGPNGNALLTVEILRNGNPVNPSVKVQSIGNIVNLFSRVLSVAAGDSIGIRVTADDMDTIVASGSWMEVMLY